jgi:hypothetical protein
MQNFPESSNAKKEDDTEFDEGVAHRTQHIASSTLLSP